jgi:hypothetical protein
MDITAMARDVALFLAPVLPFFLALGGKAAEGGAQKLGADTVAKAGKLWATLRKSAAEPEAIEAAAKDLFDLPEDGDAQGAFRLQVRKLLEANDDLAAEVAKILGEARQTSSYHAVVTGSGAVAQGPGAKAAGEGGVVIGGNVHINDRKG